MAMINLDIEILKHVTYGDKTSLEKVNSLPDGALKPDVEKAIKFVVEYYQKNLVYPNIATIQHEFDAIVEKPETEFNYVLEQVRERFFHKHAKGIINEIVTTLAKKDYDLFAEKAQDFPSKVNKIFPRQKELQRMLDEKSNFDVLENYNKRKNGIYGVITPWPSVNQITFGWQPGDFALFAARSGSGKCEAKGTKHLMHDGTIKKVEDLEVGDLLMGPDSKPRKILSLARGREEMFKVIPNKGETWGCNRSHIFSFVCTTNLDKKHRKNKIYNYSVHEYLDLPQRVQRALKLYRVPIDFKEKEVEIDPYLFGVWLGDGTKRDCCITNSKKIIGNKINKICAEYGFLVKRKPDKNTFQYWISKGENKRNFFLDLINESMIQNKRKCLDIVIPQRYLINSRQLRLKLLAGLLDTDGHLDSNNGYSIIAKFKGLSEQILFLCRTLGFAANRKEKIVKGKVYYRIYISGDCDAIPCLVKKAAPRRQIKNHLRTGFRLESQGEGDYYGFTLDGDHLYCLWDTTVTHNTWGMLIMALHAAMENHKVFFISPEMAKVSLVNRLAALYLKLNYKKIRKGELEAEDEKKYINFVKGYDVDFKDRLVVFADEFKMKLEDVCRVVEREKPSLVIVDGIYQLQTDREIDRMKRAPIVADEIKQLAKTCKVPILASTQLNKNAIKLKVRELSEEHIVLSDAYCWNADYIFFLGRDEKERERNQMILRPIKTRESEYVPEILLNWNFYKNDFSEFNSDETNEKSAYVAEDIPF